MSARHWSAVIAVAVVIAVMVLVDLLTPVGRLAGWSITAVVAWIVAYVRLLVLAWHVHHCPACGRWALHLDPECIHEDAVACPDCEVAS